MADLDLVLLLILLLAELAVINQEVRFGGWGAEAGEHFG
jgi:hypothetical protein